MAKGKDSNVLRVEVRWKRGNMEPRVFQGDTEIQVKEMTQSHDGLDFTADLDKEVEAPIVALPADEAAAAALTKEQKVAIHKAAEEAEKARKSSPPVDETKSGGN